MGWPSVNDEGLRAAIMAFRPNAPIGNALRDSVNAALPFVVFQPMGDNHHNAALCPYCTPRRRPTLEKEIAADQEVIRVDGDLECQMCGKPFREHMIPKIFAEAAPTIRLACSGALVKL